jgi:hypothetical protein
MADIPREVLSEHFQDLILKKGRVLKTAVFLTFRFDPGFFEQEVLPVFLDVPLSHEPAVRLVQLEDAIREKVDHLAVYYDPRGIEAHSSAKLDVRRIPVSWPTGFFHAKNVLLLVEDAEPDDQGDREQRLLVATLSANLTRAGWWENVEVCHVEELGWDEKSSLRGDLLKFISRVKGASPTGADHSAVEVIRRFVLRVDASKHLTAKRILHPRLYVGLAHDSDRREAVPSFLRRLLRPDLKLNLEVISPYFDNTAGAGPLRTLIDLIEPREVRVFLPLGPDGKALCTGTFFDSVRKLPNTSWGKLPADLLKSGKAESATPRTAHAKVYRFFCSSPKYEALFVGSVNLTGAAHSEGGNFETAFLIEPDPKHAPAPDWWLSVDRARPAEFQETSEDEGLKAGPGRFLVLRYSWDSGSAQALWDRQEPSPLLRLEAQGSPLFSLGPLPARESHDLSLEQGPALGSILRSTSLITVNIEGEDSATILVQEEGMAHKPSILLNLTVADILRCWAAFTPEQKAILLEERYLELAGPVSGLLVGRPLARPSKGGLFEAFAGIFHAFASLERGVLKALADKREKEAVYRLFGMKYDSLPRLLDRVLEEEKELDPVNRYVMLLCARQVLGRIEKEHPDFRTQHADEYRKLDERLAQTAHVRETLSFDSPSDRAEFLDWFEDKFLTRAQPMEVGEP